MSVETWKKEFYPSPAEDFKKLKKTERNIRRALRHSIKKWVGLLAKNRKRHGIRVSDPMLMIDRCKKPNSFFLIGTCSLCQLFYRSLACRSCILKKYTHNCIGVLDEGKYYPWGEWYFKHNPKPMLAALKKALKEFNRKVKHEKIL